MSTFIIDTSDLRCLRALVLAGSAASWAAAGERSGHPAFRIPSQTDPANGQAHIATTEGCTCDDARKGFKCKHRRAVELFLALQEAQRVVDDLVRRGRSHHR